MTALSIGSAAIADLADTLNRHLLDVAADPATKPVHDARIATRRGTALIHLVAQDPDDKKAQKAIGELKRLRNELGGARDAEIVLARFASLKPTEHVPVVEEQLRVQVALGAAHAASVAAQRREKAVASLGKVPLLEEPRAVVPQRLGALADKALRRARLVARETAWEHAHRLRISLRLLRYALEGAMEWELITGLSKEQLSPLKTAQDCLGTAMDAHVTAEAVARLAPGEIALNRRLASEAERDLKAILGVVRRWRDRHGVEAHA